MTNEQRQELDEQVSSFEERLSDGIEREREKERDSHRRARIMSLNFTHEVYPLKKRCSCGAVYAVPVSGCSKCKQSFVS